MNDPEYDELLEIRLRRVKVSLAQVEKLEPRGRYLYPALRGVPCQDFHTALKLAILDHRNDNRK